MLNSNAVKNFVLNKKNTLSENIFLCLAVTLTCAFFYYDNYYGFMGVLRVICAVLLFVVWVWCSFLSGKNNSWGFLIFTAVYWAAPYIYMLFYGMRDNVRGYSKWLSMFNKISDLLFVKPFGCIADSTGWGIYSLVLTLIAMVILAYVVGTNLSFFLRKAAKIDEHSEYADGELSEKGKK